MKDIEESINKLQNEFSEKLNETENNKLKMSDGMTHEEAMKKANRIVWICTIIAFGLTFGLIYGAWKLFWSI